MTSIDTKPILQPICLLETHIINQIAAGEVVERPASVLKELVENAIDAQASRVTIRWRQGGQSVIEVDDNGHGIACQQIRLALARHATSKLQTVSDLRTIRTFGFRGEALAAMTSIARLTLTTRHTTDAHGWAIHTEAGEEKYLQPAPREQGTCVCVEDLFFATPARLKFMRSVQLEQTYLWDVVYKMALCHPEVHFHVSTDTRTVDIPIGGAKRMALIFGPDFVSNAVDMDTMDSPYGLKGRLGLPTYHRAQADKLYIDVNGRSISDKMLFMAVRLAYGDTLPKGRHPVGWVSLTVPHDEVDVNVHPTKTEVRFLNPGGLKNWVQSTIHHHLWVQGVKAAGWRLSTSATGPTTEATAQNDPQQDPQHVINTANPSSTNITSLPISDPMTEANPLLAKRTLHTSAPATPWTWQPESAVMMAQETVSKGFPRSLAPSLDLSVTPSVAPSSAERSSLLPCSSPHEKSRGWFGGAVSVVAPDSHGACVMAASSRPVNNSHVDGSCGDNGGLWPVARGVETLEKVDLGQAVAQIHQRYIVAKTATHLIIVDQHAAHERIVYEYIKTQWGQELGHVSPFLIPTQWNQDPALCDMIHQSHQLLHDLGFTVDVKQDTVFLHSIPMIFQAYDPKELFLDLMACLTEGDDAQQALKRWRNHILANWACRHSLRAGDAMSIPAMNALLRTLEITPNGAQCNHGRCVYRQWSSQGLSQFFQ